MIIKEENCELYVTMFKFRTVVIDNSVLLKYFYAENWREFVEEILKMHLEKVSTLIATTLLPYEFCNSVARNIESEEGIVKAYEVFKNFKIRLLEPSEKANIISLKKIFQMPKVSFYDCSYHELAKEMDAVFLTADRSYYEAVKEEGSIILME